MMNRLPGLLASLALPAIMASAFAQDNEPPAETDAVEVPRHYAVEVIIFEYREDVGVGTEVFVAERIQPEPEPADDTTAEPEPSAELEPSTRPVYPFSARTLSRAELTMGETLGRLERLDAYEPLMYFGWVQPTIPAEQTPELPLARFGRVPAGLDGSIKLYLNRFLHLVVDVSLAAPPGAESAASPYADYDEAAVPTYGDARGADESGYAVYLPLRYRIAEDRIMKNGETRYYDHPKFGVIAKVTRIEEEDGAGQANQGESASVVR